MLDDLEEDLKEINTLALWRLGRLTIHLRQQFNNPPWCNKDGKHDWTEMQFREGTKRGGNATTIRNVWRCPNKKCGRTIQHLGLFDTFTKLSYEEFLWLFHVAFP